MQYTPEMATAFKAIKPPQNFGVTLYENDDFLTMEIDPKELLNISKEKAIEITAYINNIKKMLESFGAVVFIVRNSIEKSNDD